MTKRIAIYILSLLVALLMLACVSTNTVIIPHTFSTLKKGDKVRLTLSTGDKAERTKKLKVLDKKGDTVLVVSEMEESQIGVFQERLKDVRISEVTGPYIAKGDVVSLKFYDNGELKTIRLEFMEIRDDNILSGSIIIVDGGGSYKVRPFEIPISNIVEINKKVFSPAKTIGLLVGVFAITLGIYMLFFFQFGP